jgi:hypothetical protein
MGGCVMKRVYDHRGRELGLPYGRPKGKGADNNMICDNCPWKGQSECLVKEARRRLFFDGAISIRLVAYGRRDMAAYLLPGCGGQPDVALGIGRGEVAAVREFLHTCFPEFERVHRARTWKDLVRVLIGYSVIKNFTNRWVTIQRLGIGR